MISDGTAIQYQIFLAFGSIILYTHDSKRLTEDISTQRLGSYFHPRVKHQHHISIGFIAIRRSHILVLAHQCVYIDRYLLIVFQNIKRYFSLISIRRRFRQRIFRQEECIGCQIISHRKRFSTNLLLAYHDTR